MNYLVFPFGKYKGVKIEDLPSTYIILCLEQFDLPEELQDVLYGTLMGRLKVYSGIQHLLKTKDSEQVNEWLNLKRENYERMD